MESLSISISKIEDLLEKIETNDLKKEIEDFIDIKLVNYLSIDKEIFIFQNIKISGERSKFLNDHFLLLKKKNQFSEKDFSLYFKILLLIYELFIKLVNKKYNIKNCLNIIEENINKGFFEIFFLYKILILEKELIHSLHYFQEIMN